jgi:hypothetical protein
VDFDHDRAKGLLRKLRKGMGTVLAIFVDQVGTGKVFGANGEQVRLIVDKIEKVEQREADGKWTAKVLGCRFATPLCAPLTSSAKNAIQENTPAKRSIF